MKKYMIWLSEDTLVFSRPKSTKQQNLQYSLHKLQCLIDLRENLINGKTRTFSLLLLLSPTQQRSVYFADARKMQQWYELILQRQGFIPTNRFAQYEVLGQLGQGSFGTVVMARHKFSAVKFAIKVMSKAKNKTLPGDTSLTNSEVAIMTETTQKRCCSILEMIESFEDAANLYIVTKYMPAGDMLNYLIKQSTQPLTEDHARKIIRQVI